MVDTNNNGSDIQFQTLPENLTTRIWQELTRATRDRHHNWRTPALATIGLDGCPQVRTVVLRHANQALWTLDAYTDSRSPKYQELKKKWSCTTRFLERKIKLAITRFSNRERP